MIPWWTALAGCYELALTPEWKLDRLRSLAIVAEPAEPRPTDVVTFTSLAYAPGGKPITSFWLACVDGERQGCNIDSSLVDDALSGRIDPAQMTPDEIVALLEEAKDDGLIGIEPGYPPVWPVPYDALAYLPGELLNEGQTASLSVAFATDDDLELVVRRIPVSFARTPNHNPVIDLVTANGKPVDLSGVTPLLAKRGESISWNATVASGPETYDYITTDGYLEIRTEKLQWRWYTDIGRIEGGSIIDLPGPAETKTVGKTGYTAPDKPAVGAMYAVVLDLRGGMGFVVLPIEVR